MKNYMKL